MKAWSVKLIGQQATMQGHDAVTVVMPDDRSMEDAISLACRRCGFREIEALKAQVLPEVVMEE